MEICMTLDEHSEKTAIEVEFAKGVEIATEAEIEMEVEIGTEFARKADNERKAEIVIVIESVRKVEIGTEFVRKVEVEKEAEMHVQSNKQPLPLGSSQRRPLYHMYIWLRGEGGTVGIPAGHPTNPVLVGLWMLDVEVTLVITRVSIEFSLKPVLYPIRAKV
ncbi:hypothetical protein HYALB_00011049 [Hymenoscyphus albidus]|uniref:Uncharacterized protein n=1 Tax=Hymenoscyphus albidus TaxID=595503 RepID=A0A9N9LP67_9HELO|nr:hypothetical protein HYALB_00011049 [Hymenoscyphus albidus]